mgnify:CR=1 FL=1
MARKRGLSTVQQALRLLAYLADHPEGVGAKEVARHPPRPRGLFVQTQRALPPWSRS